MLISITGHTSPLGRHLVQKYQSQGHQVLGLSRTTGYDFGDWYQIHRAIQDSDGYDLFVNLAKPDYCQSRFIYALARAWEKNRGPKAVISIGSQIIDSKLDPTVDIGVLEYRTQKIALQDAHRQLARRFPDRRCLLVNPGHVNEPQLPQLVNSIDDIWCNHISCREITID